MPKKLKTHKGLLKRVKITGQGKVKHRRRGTSHLNSGIPGKRRRHLHSDTLVHASMAGKIEKALHRRVTGPKNT